MRNKFPVLFCAAVMIAGCATVKPNKTFTDPEFGEWNFYEQNVDGNYSEQNLEYVARNGNKLSNLYATSGFFHGVAFVATCSLIKNDRSCSEWNYYMINPNGEVIADFSNYKLSNLGLCTKGHPSSIYLTDLTREKGELFDFPLWNTKANGCGKYLLKDEPAFYSDRILVIDKNANRFGYFDFNGKLVIPATYKMATPFYSNGYAYVVNDDNVAGVITADGTFTPYTYACKTKLANNLFLVSKTGKIVNYKIDTRLNIGTYYGINELNNKSGWNCVGSKVGVVDNNENVIIPVDYDSITLSSDVPYIVATLDGTNYLYTKSGKGLYLDVVNADEMPGAYFFVMKDKNNKWAVGNTEGEYFTSYMYDDVRYSYKTTDLGKYVTSKYIGLKLGAKFGIFGPNGQMVLEPKFDEVMPDNNLSDLIITQRNQRYGVFYNGAEIYEPMFDSIAEFSDGKALAKMNGRDFFLFLDKEEEVKYYDSLRQTPPPRMHGNHPRSNR